MEQGLSPVESTEPREGDASERACALERARSGAADLAQLLESLVGLLARRVVVEITQASEGD
jgi:hypothetical protein